MLWERVDKEILIGLMRYFETYTELVFQYLTAAPFQLPLKNE